MILPKMRAEQQYKTKVLDHLGLVMGMCKEIGIISLIDEQITSDSADKILSTGEAIVGLVLNGLGFVNKRLYLVERFFENKPVNELFGNDYLKSEHFNDDALGRALDKVYEYGVNKLYAQISTAAVKYLSTEHGLEVKSGQLDNSNFHLHGREKELQEAERVLSITYGHSKDHRPDLVQIGLQLMVDSQSRIPLLMSVLSGNEEEGKSYGAFIKAYSKQLDCNYAIAMLIVDSKLYNKKNLSTLGDNPSMGWLTRVPHSIGAVKELIRYADSKAMKPLEGFTGYRYEESCSIYGGVNQRWLLLHSETKEERDIKQLQKRILKESEAAIKGYKKLARQSFESEVSAMEAAQEYNKTLKYNNLEGIEIFSEKHYAKRGKPKANDKPSKISYYVKAQISTDLNSYEQQKEKLGYFVLATNKLEEQEYSSSDLLGQYKNQSSVESGFRFLKNHNIVGSSLFVQKPERMTAILMVMTLCLLVYSALEFATRSLLKKEDLSFENQIGKPIHNPTMKWIFECFEGIHVLYINEKQRLVLNLKPKQQFILDLLGQNFNQFYT